MFRREQSAELVLASGSLRRQQLLQGLGLRFTTVVSGAAEDIQTNLSPHQFVETLAERKASHVRLKLLQEGRPHTVILAADTVVVFQDTILGKPGDESDAVRMLGILQGKEHKVYTGVCVMSAGTDMVRTRHSVSKVRMRPLSEEKILRYVSTGEPLDKAGSYGIQGFGATLIESIEGDYFTVVGLPLLLTTDLLEEFGISIWPSL